MWLDSAFTETNILYTDGHTDRRTHTRTDRLIPVYPRKHSFCEGIDMDLTKLVAFTNDNLSMAQRLKFALTLSQTSPGFYVSAV